MIAHTQTHVGKYLLGHRAETIEDLLAHFVCLSALIGPDVLGTVERGPVGRSHLHRDPNPPPYQLSSGNLYVRPDEGFIILNLISV